MKRFKECLISYFRQKNIIVGVIDSPWALDRDGNRVNTYFKLEKHILIQVIALNKKSKFPIKSDSKVTKLIKTKTKLNKSFRFKIYRHRCKGYPRDGWLVLKNGRSIGIFQGKSSKISVNAGISGKFISINIGRTKSTSEGVDYHNK